MLDDAPVAIRRIGPTRKCRTLAMDTRVTPEQASSVEFREIERLNPLVKWNFESTYNFPPVSRKTIIVRLNVRSGKLQDI
jgi:hypothetical protein